MTDKKEGQSLLLRRDNKRFAFWSPDQRPSLPPNFSATLTPKSVEERARRVRVQKSD